MTIDEMAEVIKANKTNEYIFKHLDDNGMDILIKVMELLDKNDFKEVNPNGRFTFMDIPMPYEQLNRRQFHKKREYSPEVMTEMRELLNLINHPEKSREYPYVFSGSYDETVAYSGMKKMQAGNSRSCSYDWAWIEEHIKKTQDTALAIFHTHPNIEGKNLTTIYNAYPKLAEVGVKPNGRNISIADLYANMYADMLVKKYNKNIKIESHILMHSGELVTFSTRDGIVLEDVKHIQRITLPNTGTERTE